MARKSYARFRPARRQDRHHHRCRQRHRDGGSPSHTPGMVPTSSYPISMRRRMPVSPLSGSEKAGRKAVLVPGTSPTRPMLPPSWPRRLRHSDASTSWSTIAGYQMRRFYRRDHAVEDWNRHFAVNVHAMFYIVKAALPLMPKGGSIVNTASMNAKMPMPGNWPTRRPRRPSRTSPRTSPDPRPHGIRANAVARPLWTPLITSEMSDGGVEGLQAGPDGTSGQPAELAPALRDARVGRGSYVSAPMIAVTGGVALL